MPGSHNLDRKFRGSGSLTRINWTPCIWCVEWWQEISHKIQGRFWGSEKADKRCTICSHPRRPAKVAQGILQGIYSAAISGNHCTDIVRVFCTSVDAGGELPAALVRYRIQRSIIVVVVNDKWILYTRIFRCLLMPKKKQYRFIPTQGVHVVVCYSERQRPKWESSKIAFWPTGIDSFTLPMGLCVSIKVSCRGSNWLLCHLKKIIIIKLAV